MLLVGFALRTYDLTGTPPGIDGDEMFYFIDASRVLQGHLQLYFPTNFGHEPLFVYTEAVLIWLLGAHAFTLRYTAVISGMLSLAIGYALARRLFGARVALVTTALLATLFWPVFITRVGLRAFTYPLLSMFSIYALWRALQERSWGWTVAAGIFNGLILYTYLASRVFPLAILLWLLALLVLDRRQWLSGNNAWRAITILVMAGLIILPFAIYAFQHPDVVNKRMYTMGGPYYEVRHGDYHGLMENAKKVLGMAIVRGEPDVRYNADARPVFDPFTGMLFYAGTITALLRIRRPAYYLLFIWLCIGLLPTLLSASAPSFLRSGGALFPLLALPGIGIDGVLSLLRHRRTEWTGRWLSGYVPGVLVGAGALALFTASVMFGPWRTSPGLMAVYESDVYLAARYLDENPPPSDAAIFGVSKYATDNAPLLFGLQARRPDRVRWTADMVWPAAQGEAWYLFHQDAPADAQTRAWLGAPPVHSEFNNEGGLVLEVYRLPQAPAPPQPAVPLHATFDALVDLIGADYRGPFERGRSAEILLYWRVRPDAAFDPTKTLGVSLRLESRGIPWAEGGGALVSFPPIQWRAADVWVQRATLKIPVDMPPQSIQPVLTLHVEGRPWPVIPEGEIQARPHYLLPAIQITGQPTETLAAISLHQFGDVLLLRSAGASSSDSQPGLPIFVHTTWQALHDLNRDYALQIRLCRPDGNTAALATQVIWEGIYPTHRWRQGEVISSNDALRVPVDLQEGDYRLQIRVTDVKGDPIDEGEWFDLGCVHISGRPHVFEQPPIEASVDAEIEGVARLAGYRLDLGQATPGGAIRLTLIWQALRPSERPLRVFTHLYNMTDTTGVYAQHDGDPANGQAPTTGWLAGEYIEDEHILPIAPSVAPGQYRLAVGMYDPETLERATILLDGETADAFILTALSIRQQ